MHAADVYEHYWQALFKYPSCSVVSGLIVFPAIETAAYFHPVIPPYDSDVTFYRSTR